MRLLPVSRLFSRLPHPSVTAVVGSGIIAARVRSATFNLGFRQIQRYSTVASLGHVYRRNSRPR